MKRLLLTAILIMAVSVSLLFGGCGSKVAATLEDLAAADSELTAAIEEKLTTPAGTESGIAFSGDSFDITYTYKDQLEESAAKKLKAAFEKNSGSLAENCNKAISDMETQTGISGITGSIIVLNADGSEIWKLEIPVEEKE